MSHSIYSEWLCDLRVDFGALLNSLGIKLWALYCLQTWVTVLSLELLCGLGKDLGFLYGTECLVVLAQS